ncbi:MAG: hypothetical protein K8R68_09195 [Bacteroidales bacterium]|nr:hypothetical protein [Bacteroidales bacterium]
MKKNQITLSINFIFILGIIVSIYLLQGCQKDVEPIYTESKTVIGKIKILDSHNGSLVCNPIVKLNNKILKVSNEGFLEFPISFLGNNKLFVSAEDYTFTTYNPIIEENYVFLRNIYLKKKGSFNLINEYGGEIFDSLTNNRVFSLNIPENAVSSEVNISLTPIEGLESVAFSNNCIPIAEVDISSDKNIIFTKPCQLTFSLPYVLINGSKLPLYVFNSNTLLNEYTKLYAIVNDDGKSASINIISCGRYSLCIDNPNLNIIGTTENSNSNDLNISITTNDIKVKLPDYENPFKILEFTPSDMDTNFIYSVFEKLFEYKINQMNEYSIIINNTQVYNYKSSKPSGRYRIVNTYWNITGSREACELKGKVGHVSNIDYDYTLVGWETQLVGGDEETGFGIYLITYLYNLTISYEWTCHSGGKGN